MLNIIVSILVGISIYCVAWIRTLKKAELVNDKTNDALLEILKCQNKEIEILRTRIKYLEITVRKK